MRSVPSRQIRSLSFRRGRARGSAILYTAVILPVLLLLCALAVDWGHVTLTKLELSRACDAAARYAVAGLSDGTTYSKANWVAGQNPVDGQPVSLAVADVQSGQWDTTTRTFIPGASSPNAVRVSASRTVPATFASFAGGAPKIVAVHAIAKFNLTGFGLIGLNGLTFNGHATASYWSSSGAAVSGGGNIASNGTVSIGGSSTVNGNVYLGPGGQVAGGQINGTTNTLPAPLSYPNGDASPYGLFNNDDNNVSASVMSGNSFSANNKNVTLPGGHYFFNNFSMGGNATLSFSGPATIYCYGSFSMTGTTNTSGNIPGNLKLVMVPNPLTGAAPGSVSIGGNAAFYASIYAPQSAVTIGGTGDIYGSILGKTVAVTGTGNVYYDMSLDANNGTISLVE